MIIQIVTLFLHFFSLVDVADLIGVKGPIHFHKTEFELALSGNPDNGMYLHVYLPKGENIETYNQKMSILVIKSNKDINEIIKSKLKDLALRKKKDFNCQYSNNELIEGKEFLVEAITTESNDKSVSEAEYTLSRVTHLESTDTEHTILIYSYSWRTYDSESQDLLKNIHSFKQDYIEEISKATLPVVKIGN